MKKTVRWMLCMMVALVLAAGAGILLGGGTASESIYAAKTDYSSAYKVSGQKITIKSGYKNKDITEILNAALEAARDKATAKKPVTVKLPKGTYKLTSNLRIYSNTTLDLTGVTLKYTGKESHVMLQSGINGSYKGVSDYNNSKKCAGYNGFENITVKGGTFESSTSNTGTIIRIAHAKNVTIDGVTLKGGGCAHQMEVAAINGFYVKNCSFLDWNGAKSPEEGAGEKYEALQLDIPCASKVFKNVYQDGTVMKNVEITGCTFSNVPRGVGTHTFLVGAYHENIKINNNTFKNIGEEAIVCLGYKNSEVKDNTITNCGGGVLFQYFKANTSSIYSTTMDGKKKASGKVEHDANSVISGNKITIKYTTESDEIQAIKVYGVNLEKAAKGADGKKLTAQNYYISGVTVTKNTIVTAGYGIHLIDARDCTITDNTITGKGVKSSDPQLQIANYDGIYLTEGSTAKKITGNKISAMIGRGINLYKSSSVSGEISGNTITGCQDGGMFIHGSAKANKITGNTFKEVTGDSGITLYNESSAAAISDNVIEVTGKASDGDTHGIKLSTNSVAESISDNRITTGDRASSAMLGSGILICKDSKVTGSISGNNISSAKAHGIFLSTSASVAGSIENNIIDTVQSNGIFVHDTSGASTVTAIKNNTIKNAGKFGINLVSATNDVTISQNNISGCQSHAVMIQMSSTSYTITIADNTISGSGEATSAIHVTKGKVYVSGNTLSNAGFGVHVAKEVKGTIDMNNYGDGILQQIYIGGKKYTQTSVIQL